MKTIETLAIASMALALSTGVAMAAAVTVKGTVTDVFGHRYVVDEGGKKSLIDIGPKGSDSVSLKSGDSVTIEGELTGAGEVRAQKVAVGSAAAVELQDKSWWDKLTGGGDDKNAKFGPEEAKAIVAKAGYEPVGEPQPEKKHFEVLAQKDGKYFEVHAHRNGDVKHERVVDASNSKWGSLIK